METQPSAILMKEKNAISGFSKLTKQEKLNYIAGFASEPDDFKNDLQTHWHINPEMQKLYDEFAENTISNFYLPFSIAPNFLINGKFYLVPMVIEESSVIAAASNSAKFWADNGGFHAEVVSTVKVGQIHILWKGNTAKLRAIMPEIKAQMLSDAAHLTTKMVQRGGGILDIELVDMTDHIVDYFQIKASFDTVDAMGANFINSCLEQFDTTFKNFILRDNRFIGVEKECYIIMSILTNYTPDCLVNCSVECEISKLGKISEDMTPDDFVRKFEYAVKIAQVDVNRATTHNKGIFNGIVAVAMATGNDLRAVEAGGHTFAARSGKYKGLTKIEIQNGIFKYSLSIPLALGTVGGLTSLHPLAKRSLEILGNPTAKELMMVAASVGLANNFGALKSLVTSGIQKGHMKMHLMNILNSLHAVDYEKELAFKFFKESIVTHRSVEEFIQKTRNL